MPRKMLRKMPRKMPLVSLRALLSEWLLELHIYFISNLSKSSTIKCYSAWWSFFLPRNEIDKGIGSRMMLSSGKYEFLILYQLYSFQSISKADKKIASSLYEEAFVFSGCFGGGQKRQDLVHAFPAFLNRCNDAGGI